MTTLTNWLRKNLGLIVSSIGLVLLAILTFGDIGELFTQQYWENVGGNISSISALTIGLVMVQVAIKQGVSEQALSAGLNTKTTKEKYEEHKKIINDCREKSIYLPYFLSFRNERETKRRKEEFLVDNNFTSEKMLRLSKDKRLIKKYERIRTNITVDSIKWSTTEIVYNKNGRIEKLDKYRSKRTLKAIVVAFVMMFATTLIAGGLFLDTTNIPIWQKIVKFFTYLITMTITIVFDISKNYEKGAFGVPNELDEVNNIWKEFFSWTIPDWVIKEVENNEKYKTNNNENNDLKNNIKTEDLKDFKEKEDETREMQENFNSRRDLQEEPIEIQNI